MLLKKFFNLGFEAIEVHGRRPFGLDSVTRYPLFTQDFLDLLRETMPSERLAELVLSIVVTARRPGLRTMPRRCRSCHHDNPADARFCPSCGHGLLFPADERRVVTVLFGTALGGGLETALAAVLTQTLLPAAGGTLVVASELLVVGYGARQHVRKNALQHLHQEITITRKAGSHTLEESLAKLVQQGVLDRKEASMRAAHPDELESILGKG